MSLTGRNKISYRLRDEKLREQVRSLAASTSNIAITEHAQERMFERNISYDMALDILRNGEVRFQETDRRGNAVIKASKSSLGQRSASAVAAVIDKQGRLILITVMWDDGK